jgi:hypothetical protein
MQTPPIGKLRRPGFESNGVANETRKMLIVQPADGLFVCLDADSDAVVARTGLALFFARVAEVLLASHSQYFTTIRTTYLCHRSYPLRIIIISPCLSVVPCHLSVSCSSSTGISCLDTGLGAFPFVSSYHLSQSHSTPRPTIPPFSHQLCVPFVSVLPACSCVRPL